MNEPKHEQKVPWSHFRDLCTIFKAKNIKNLLSL